MGLVDRVKNILLKPKEEWGVIASEQADVKTLYTTYIMLLAAIPAVAGILSSAMFGGALNLGFAAMGAVVSYLLGLAMVFILGHVASALAPSFNGEKNFMQAFKLMAYSMTAGWIGGAFTIIPVLGWLVSIAASIYGLYLLYLGVTPLMKVPEAKAVGYTIVLVVATIVVSFVIFSVAAGITALGAVGASVGLR